MLVKVFGYLNDYSYIDWHKINKLMSEDTAQLVKEYVYKNYKTYKDKQLIIRDFGNHFRVLKHKDGSPLILGKSIIEENA